MVKRAVMLNLDHDNVEYLKGKRINISAYTDRFIAELCFAVKRGGTIQIGRVEEKVEHK